MNKENYHSSIRKKIAEKQRALAEKEMNLRHSCEQLVDHFTPGYMVKRAAAGLIQPREDGGNGLLKTGALVGAVALAERIFFKKSRFLTRTLGTLGMRGISRLFR